MKRYAMFLCSAVVASLLLVTASCSVDSGSNEGIEPVLTAPSSQESAMTPASESSTPEASPETTAKPGESSKNPTNSEAPENKEKKTGESKQYSIRQATSDRGQLNTIAFSGLAFITGTAGADSFFPPGKVADFFGFQYMRDNDQNGLGHNTTFLTIAAANIISILDEDQLAKLTDLAEEQASLFEKFALGRFVMMKSFRDNMEGNVPEGMSLDIDAVSEFSSYLYEIDASLSYDRARVMGEIISSFTDEQKAYMAGLDFHDSSTWPVIDEKSLPINKKGISHTEKVAVMTYASELFSWYLGNIEADTYFCPERHGTCFGGFYMKDYHAMGNPDYFISTTVTGDSGEMFLQILNDNQRIHVTSLIEAQKENLDRIVAIRQEVSEELRKSISGDTIDRALVFGLVREYGRLEGEMSYMYANAFAEIKKTLTEEQLSELYKLRNLDIYPEGAFLFSTPIEMPVIEQDDLLFR